MFSETYDFNPMRPTQTAIPKKEVYKSLIIDFLALTFIAFAPALAHLLSFPMYMLEPMRLMLIISLAHSTKTNSYLLAIFLPFFSFLVSGHPVFVKMLIITIELMVNVFLFYFILSRTKHLFGAIFSSIVISKVLCYLLYLVVFSWSFVVTEAAPFFLVVQLLTTLIFSGYIYFANRQKLKS